MEVDQPSTPTITAMPVDTSTTPDPRSTSTSNGVTTEHKDKGDILKLALNHLVQGKRHLLVKDITAAITSLGESCQLLAEANGPLSADNAEAHYYYGKSLLEQARMDLAVFDGGAPVEKGEESQDSDEEEEDDDDDNDGDDQEEENKESSEATAAVGGKKENDSDPESSADEKQPDEILGDKVEDETKTEEDLSTPSPVGNSVPVNVVQDNEQPSTSSGIVAEVNGTDKEGEEEPSNLELAWEVLEIAKLGYNAQLKLAIDQLETSSADVEEEKSKMKTKLHLQKRLSETHSLLGEVATESENYPQAVEDFKTAIQIMTEIEGTESREVAQYYFYMGLAHSFAKEFQEAIESFHKSKAIIELRMSNLQLKIDNKETAKDLGQERDANFTENDEIEELKTAIEGLDEKLLDTLDAERESKAAIAEHVQEMEIAEKNSPVKNPNPPAVNDISHLVKKKKKAEEPLDVPPPKRVCNENNGVSASKTEEITSTNGHENGGVKKTLEF